MLDEPAANAGTLSSRRHAPSLSHECSFQALLDQMALPDTGDSVEPCLILVRGLPGSGKSTLAERIVNRLAGVNIAVLDPDQVDEGSPEFAPISARMTTQGIPSEIHVYRHLLRLACDDIAKGEMAIWNQPFTSEVVFRSMLRTVTSISNSLQIRIIEMSVDPDTAFRRMANRVERGGHGVPPDRFREFVASYRSFRHFGFPTFTACDRVTS
jgi:predicted ABC-type ATPase